MTIQEKLEIFAERTSKEVNRKRHEVTLEIKEAIKAAVKEEETAAHREMADQIKTANKELERNANKKINAAKLAARQKMAELRDQLSAELFTELKYDLLAFTKTSNYGEFLFTGISLISKSLASESLTSKSLINIEGTHSNFTKVLLMSRDLNQDFLGPVLMKKLEDMKLKLEKTEEDFIGGFKLVSENERVIADYTFLARLEELDNDRGNLWHKWSGPDGG